jgi:two-component system phosphate regulon sensor histidine kinase PhoR
VETDFPPNMPRVRFDSEAVSQAALNLVDNAAKFSDESKYVAVRMRSSDESVVFEVEDHGIGIEPGELDQLFRQFYRSRRGRAKGGYGLGLFLVKHIMDAHDGKVEVDSTAGKGSGISVSRRKICGGPGLVPRRYRHFATGHRQDSTAEN